MSEWELRERREREEGKRAEAEELGHGESWVPGRSYAVPAHARFQGIHRSRGRVCISLSFVFISRSRFPMYVFSFTISLVCIYPFSGQACGGQRGACNVPSPRGQRRRFGPQFELSPRECILYALKEAEEARNDRDKQKWTYKNSAGELVFLRDRFDRIVEGIDKYAKAVDIAVNHSPEITSLVWASARFLLQVSPGFQSPC